MLIFQVINATRILYELFYVAFLRVTIKTDVCSPGRRYIYIQLVYLYLSIHYGIAINCVIFAQCYDYYLGSC